MPDVRNYDHSKRPIKLSLDNSHYQYLTVEEKRQLQTDLKAAIADASGE